MRGCRELAYKSSLRCVWVGGIVHHDMAACWTLAWQVMRIGKSERQCVLHTQAGGQRLAQIVLYLTTLSDPHVHGGGTRFHHPVFRGLTVQPKRGDALVFFTAFRDGRIDERMPHSGLPVLDSEKWIINTWLCERPVPERA